MPTNKDGKLCVLCVLTLLILLTLNYIPLYLHMKYINYQNRSVDVLLLNIRFNKSALRFELIDVRAETSVFFVLL
jgi:hypothetical protein